MKKIDNAFTGLEAAIVLIAFVVVAAVFSYVMLGAGFFTAQEAQSVVHTGMGQAASSIEVVGDVYGFNVSGAATDALIDNISFTISLTAGNSPMDLSRMRVSLATQDNRAILSITSATGIATPGAPGTGEWAVTRIYDQVNEGDLVLDPKEKFQINVIPPAGQLIGADTRFTISMQPEIGALTTVVRTTPGDIKTVNILR